MKDRIFYVGWLAVCAIRRPNGRSPAWEWYEDLDKRSKAKVISACKTMETTLRSGRPPAGRANKVENSTQGVWELRITRKGSTPPHLRALYVREGRVLWVAHGLTKQQNELKQRDIDFADSVVAEWREARS